MPVSNEYIERSVDSSVFDIDGDICEPTRLVVKFYDGVIKIQPFTVCIMMVTFSPENKGFCQHRMVSFSNTFLASDLLKASRGVREFSCLSDKQLSHLKRHVDIMDSMSGNIEEFYRWMGHHPFLVHVQHQDAFIIDSKEEYKNMLKDGLLI